MNKVDCKGCPDERGSLLVMTVNPLVFSNNPRYRLTRHALFWSLWILYYTVFQTLYWQGKYPFGKSFAASFAEVASSTPLDMIFCYTIIYFVLPHLFKGRYIGMTLFWLALSLCFIVVFVSYSFYVVPYIRKAFGMPAPVRPHNEYWLFLSLFYQINMEGCLAAAIKLGKMWFIKQQELDLQPVFPVNVSLEKELRLLEEYLALQQSGMGEDLHLAVSITGKGEDERIAPFIILPLVENGFRQLTQLDMPDKFINIVIRTDEGHFSMKVWWNKPIDSSTLINGNNQSLQHIGKRLNLLYPQSHGLKVIITAEQFMIDLRMDLRRAIN